jgi:carbon monoxide dehydrogenase subunit G
MAHAENRITVPRSGSETWAFLTDLDHLPAWIPAVRHVELLGGTAGEVGADYLARVEVAGQEREGRLMLTRVDAPSLLAMRISASPLTLETRVTVDDHGDSATVTVALDAPTSGLMRLMDGQIQRALQESLDELPRLRDALTAS